MDHLSNLVVQYRICIVSRFSFYFIKKIASWKLLTKF